MSDRFLKIILVSICKVLVDIVLHKDCATNRDYENIFYIADERFDMFED